MGSIINEKIKYIKLYIFQMAAQHCRITMYSMNRYLLPGNNKSSVFSEKAYKLGTKEGNKYWKQIK